MCVVDCRKDFVVAMSEHTCSDDDEEAKPKKRSCDQDLVASESGKRGRKQEPTRYERLTDAQEVIEGLPSLVRMFAAGWFPPVAYNLLCKGAIDLSVSCDKTSLCSVENFRTAFLHICGKPKGDWNTSLKDVVPACHNQEELRVRVLAFVG